MPASSSSFPPGRSGNPAGRPRGARSRQTQALEQLLDGEADALGRKAVELALAGDTVALRLCLERILPVRKDRPILFPLPKLETAADAKAAAAAIVQAVADGDLTPSEAADMSKLLDNFTRVLEATDFQNRLELLERKTSQ